MSTIEIKSEDMPILSSTEPNKSPVDPHDEFIESSKGQIRRVTVEPLVLFYVIVMYLQTSVIQQYVYYRVGVDYNITTNSTMAYVCDPHSNDTAEKEKVDRIQIINSNYLTLISLCNAATTIIFAPFYCVFSDRFGRRIMCLIPGTGVFIKSIIDLLIILKGWPIYLFAVSDGFYGCCGGYNFALNIAYSYIADITTKRTRTKRIALVGIVMAIGVLIVSLVAGIWIQHQGYLIPYAFSFAVACLCLIYPIFLLKESPKMIKFNVKRLAPWTQFKTLFTIYSGRPRLQSTLLVIVVIMFIFYYVAEMSGIGLWGTYLMAFPICMSAMQIGIFGFLNMLSINIGVVITLIGLARCFSDLSIVLICLLSGIIYSVQMAVVTTQLAAYIAAMTNLLSFTAFPFIRGYLSKKIGPHEQGALFGGLVLFETIGGAITRVLVVYVYRMTFQTYHGLVFFFICCFSLVAAVLAIAAKIVERKVERKGFMWHPVN